MTKDREYWEEKAEQLPLIIKLLAITILMPILVLATIGILYKNTIQRDRFVKGKMNGKNSTK